MKDTYPIVRFPSEIKIIMDWDPLADERPVKPSPPIRRPPVAKPTLPIKPSEPKLEKDSLGCLSVFFIIPIVYSFLLSNQKRSEFWGIIGWGFIITFVYFLFRIISKNGENDRKYNIDKANYPKSLKLWQVTCVEIQHKYEAELKGQDFEYKLELDFFEQNTLRKYESEIKEFEEYKQSEDARTKAQKQKIKRLKNYLSKINNVEDYKSKFNPRKGVSEQGFYDFMVEKLKPYNDSHRVKLYTQKTIPNSSYLPDLLFEFKIGDQYLRVDIEIDEPYVGNDGKPIHYVGSNDISRDNYFLANSWIVIRFAEEQVVKNPEECFHFILSTLHKCIFYKKIYWQEESALLLPILKRWTKEGSYAMAFRRYRNTYLKKDFIENLPLEEETEEPKPREFPYPGFEIDGDIELPF